VADARNLQSSKTLYTKSDVPVSIQYERIEPTREPLRLLQQLRLYVLTAGREFGWLYLPPILVALFLFRRLPPSERAWMVSLGAIYASLALLLLVIINPSPDAGGADSPVKVFYSASYVVLAIWLGMGLGFIASLMINRLASEAPEQ